MGSKQPFHSVIKNMFYRPLNGHGAKVRFVNRFNAG